MLASNDRVSVLKAEEPEAELPRTTPPTPSLTGLPRKPRDLKHASPAPMPLHLYPLKDSEAVATQPASPGKVSTWDILLSNEEIMTPTKMLICSHLHIRRWFGMMICQPMNLFSRMMSIARWFQSALAYNNRPGSRRIVFQTVQVRSVQPEDSKAFESGHCVHTRPYLRPRDHEVSAPADLAQVHAHSVRATGDSFLVYIHSDDTLSHSITRQPPSVKCRAATTDVSAQHSIRKRMYGSPHTTPSHPCLMDLKDDLWHRKCACGKSFYQPNSYSNHVNSCSQHKQSLSASLDIARERYAKRKKHKKGKDAIESWYQAGEDDLDVDHGISGKPDTRQPSPALPDAPATPLLGRGLRIRAPAQKYKDFSATSAIPFEIPMFGLEIETPPETPSPGPSSTSSSPFSEQRRSVLEVSKWKITRKSGFRLCKTFWTLEIHPHDPELFFSDSNSLEPSDDERSPPQVTTTSGSSNPFHPFPNWSSFKLGEWFWGDDGGKSRESFQRLVGIISDEEFIPSDIRHTGWKKIETMLASSEYDDPSAEGAHWVQDGSSWQAAPVTVDVPFNSATNQPGSKQYTLDGFRFRPLIPIIVSKLQDKRAFEHFHIVPSELRWDRNDDAGYVRVHGEIYHSEAFLEAYRDVQLLPPEDEDHLARSVVALMLSSDETHLTSFGNAHLWPVYLQFGNESKYRRGKASLALFEEVAYFQKLPDSFVDWYLERSGRSTIADDIVTHVRRDLFQAQWGILLDEEFVHAYKHGIVVECADGVKRRLYPRILTYAADYPEKMRVVGLRANGGCPCPRCLVPADAISRMGTVEDREVRRTRRRVDDETRKMKVENARKFIFGSSNYAVDAAKVEGLLKDTSLTPARNAFSERLSLLGLNVYDLPAVDILHEVEIGVWKSLFVHLLRLLEVIGDGKRDVLNRRFRQIPTFGKDTIRRFSQNVADMKQLAARDLEDILQCALPAFEGLFPGDHDGRVQDLIFALAHWHALSKLRMHTELTLEVLDLWTSIVGEASRVFAKLTCDRFKTSELKREYEARMRREARQSAMKGVRGGNDELGKQAHTADSPSYLPDATSQLRSALEQAPVAQPVPHLPVGAKDSGVRPNRLKPASAVFGVEQPKVEKTVGRKPRKWSLSTPKFHSMGDVVHYIRKMGTTDSYSTQLSERFHRFPKSRYRRTNKKNVPRQLSLIQTRQARIKRLRGQLYPSRDEVGPFEQPFTSEGNGRRYFIGQSQNQPVKLPHFIRLNSNDRATKACFLASACHLKKLINVIQGFMQKLKCHMFPRIIEALIQQVQAGLDDYPGECLAKLITLSSKEPSERDLDNIYFHSDTIYRHNVLQVPYIMDDCRQNVDTINPRTSRRDFMCLPACNSPQDSSTGTRDGEGFIYGRVLGIFHANIVYRGAGALDYRRRRFDFLWVRWFTTIAAYPWSSKRLDRVRLAPVAEVGSCDFIDPADILRAAHIIPRFATGQLHNEKDAKKAIFSKAARDDLDWKEYYVNRFVDRDMAMRFHPDPMEVDAPDILEGQATDVETASEGSDESIFQSSEEESDDEEYHIPEPDSEEEPDIYGYHSKRHSAHRKKLEFAQGGMVSLLFLQLAAGLYRASPADYPGARFVVRIPAWSPVLIRGCLQKRLEIVYNPSYSYGQLNESTLLIAFNMRPLLFNYPRVSFAAWRMKSQSAGIIEDKPDPMCHLAASFEGLDLSNKPQTSMPYSKKGTGSNTDDQYWRTRLRLQRFVPGPTVQNLRLLSELGSPFGRGLYRYQVRQIVRECSRCHGVCFMDKCHLHECQGLTLCPPRDGPELMEAMLCEYGNRGLRREDFIALLDRCSVCDRICAGPALESHSCRRELALADTYSL
ncbi:hypothetical protein NMY22_g7246 [Coprinellus aureogranulatus]|nr:hypothetical protein NMY22_g7246 [Coprinellus aureogranulatus]